MLRESKTRYRALERIETREIWDGVDENDEPIRFDENRSVTYYDDGLFVCHEETAVSRMRDKIKDKKRKKNNVKTDVRSIIIV